MWKFGWEKPVAEDFELSAHRWFQIAIIVAALAAVFFVCAGLAVMAQKDTENAQKLAQAFSPFFVGLIAAVTFCGAVWRGKINSEQSKQQRRQNDAKDDENLAKLLVDGTKLVSDDYTKKAQVHAGIAALQVVITAPQDRFAVNAMDILVDVIHATYSDPAQEFVFDAARLALQAGANLKRVSTRRVDFTATSAPYVGPDWHALNGARRVRYEGGVIVRDEYAKIEDLNATSFHGVKFDSCQIVGAPIYHKGCDFTDCSFDRVSGALLARCTFDGCDFSNVTFEISTRARQIDLLRKLSDSGNFYHVESPPTLLGREIDWSEFIEVREAPPTEGIFG